MFIALNRFTHRHRRRLMMVAAVLAVSGAIVTAHSVMGGDHIGTGGVMCVAVLEIGALAAAGAAAGPPRALLGSVRLRLPRTLPAVALLAFPPEPRARAAPPGLQVFRL